MLFTRLCLQENAASLDYDAMVFTEADVKAAVTAMQKLRALRGADEGFVLQGEGLLGSEDNPATRLQLAAELVQAWRPSLNASGRCAERQLTLHPGRAKAHTSHCRLYLWIGTRGLVIPRVPIHKLPPAGKGHASGAAVLIMPCRSTQTSRIRRPAHSRLK